ncbi:hypothetical protein ACHQM5_011334 [Ranunculus cassubicifolius]
MGSPTLSRYGYDRKAQLLAYARKLRSNYQGGLPRRTFQSKTTKLKWKPFRGKSLNWRIFSLSRNKGWKYEHIETLDTKPRRDFKYYLRRLRCILKRVSSCTSNWKCTKS